MAEVKGWHFHNGKTLRDGRPLPEIGEWLIHKGPIVFCESGLHYSERLIDALGYAPGCYVDRVTVRGVAVEKHEDKGVARERRHDSTIDATPVLVEFARWCADRAQGYANAAAARYADADESRYADADESRYAADDARYAAARYAAARYTAANAAAAARYAAARYAAAANAAAAARYAAAAAVARYAVAWYAERDAQNEKLTEMVLAALAKGGV